MLKIFITGLVLMSFVGVAQVKAEETTKEKVGEVASDANKGIKKSYRALKDKTCEMVNGKMECVAKKIKHKAENAKDEISDKVDDVKKAN